MKKQIVILLALVAIDTNLFAAEAGMPQLDPKYWASQAFWLDLESPIGSMSPCPPSFHSATPEDTSNGAKSWTDKREGTTRGQADMAEEMKQGRAMSTVFLMPRPPERTGRLACVHASSEKSTLVIELRAFFTSKSKSPSRSKCR